MQALVDLWAAAWSEKTVVQYLACYSVDVSMPGKQSRPQWEALRRSRLTRPRTIEVKVVYEKLKVTEPNVIQVIFDQTYRSNLYRDRTRKQLLVRKEREDWRIMLERSL